MENKLEEEIEKPLQIVKENSYEKVFPYDEVVNNGLNQKQINSTHKTARIPSSLK